MPTLWRTHADADIVGRERVTAGTDCGFGTFAGYGKMDPDITYVKFQAMFDGGDGAVKRLRRAFRG
jgi:5-methyltetrahydropteroyltriglutamate--homocysteine methyltransferase